MKELTLGQIAAWCGAEIKKEDSQINVTCVQPDSRQIRAGELFVAICGERVDGHDYIAAAAERGASAALVSRPVEAEIPCLLVDDTIRAYGAIAAGYRQLFPLRVVGVTGSVGKTSTKEVIASVLKEKYRTLKTQGNFNNELGLPLTVFRLREDDQIAVLEMGISDFGEMTRLTRIAKPDTCVITNIGTCHLENLGDRDGVLKAKTEIFQSMQPNGHIVLNGDDDKLATVDGYHGVKPVFFGLDAKRDVYADQIVSWGLKGVSCCIHMGEDAFDVLVPTPGIHMVYNALAAAAVGRIYGLTIEEIKRGIESLETIRGRFKMIETENFLVVVLHDGEGRRVAILGDMGELGENEISLHKEVGEHAAKCGIDVCICVGELSVHMADAARTADPNFEVHYEKDRESLLKNLEGYVRKGDTILVKASHFMKFEEVVDALEKM